MPEVFLQGLARPLLVLHALTSLALAGSATHLVIVSGRLWGGASQLTRLARVYAQVLGATFAAAFLFGLLLYPHYRYHVRGLYLDRYEPWASNLFDIKESFAALGLPLAVAIFFVGRRLTVDERPEVRQLFLGLSVLLWGLLAVMVVAGLVVTSVRGV